MARKKIGVFVCHCGLNIASTVDVEKVVENIKKYPGVEHAENYIYMCSDPGQNLVRAAIREKGLDGIVMSNCSPSLHLNTFRKVAASEGLNPYHCDVANIREWCSWPHAGDRETATKKALNIIKGTIERVRLNMELFPMIVPLTKKVMVIGAGVSGMQAALDIADGGFPVILVDRQPHLGGHAVQLGGLVITMDDALCSLNSMMQDVVQHPNIELHVNTEVENVDGYVGSFETTLKHKARYVDWDKCDGCGKCIEVCPATASSEFDRGLGQRKAIYTSYPGSFPGKPIIDAKSCLNLNGEECDACIKVCPHDAIDFDLGEEEVQTKVGAMVVATGYDLYDKKNLTEYAEDPDILDGLQFERLLAPTGPTGGVVRRPSDGKIPKEVVFIKCAGSRDPEHHFPYCSRFCCMYTGKQARIYKRLVPDGQAYVFYMDIRSTGKGYEEFIKAGIEEQHLLYIRGRVSKIYRRGDKLVVMGADTLSNSMVEVEADMVVLAMAATGADGSRELGKTLNIITDMYGFASEAHLKLGPLETLTAGIYLCGSAPSPKDIPDSVYQGSGAAAKVLSLFSRKELLHNPEIAHANEETCAGCGLCESICAYQAPKVDPRLRIAIVNEALCEGCGACAGLCPSGAMQLRNFTNKQVDNMISVSTDDYELIEII
ncbi:CoB--CoM heterodisulfide reductase iron-sulfur subunit A family protein [candidate division KSB1 bacterium]|nr:CoB--CoM heterodisulfide reductase iron-sulfur subunit A family protein [candidate division KSB1 bacterium]